MSRDDRDLIVVCAETAEHFSRQLMREVDCGNLQNADWCQQVAEFAAIQAFHVANGVA